MQKNYYQRLQKKIDVGLDYTLILAISICLSIFLFTSVSHAQEQPVDASYLLTNFFTPVGAIHDPRIPTKIFISNPSTTSFTINWYTPVPTKGSVIFSINDPVLHKRSLDKRDSINNEKERFSHSVDIVDTSLSHDDMVFFKLVSNNFEISNNGENFQFQPPAALNSPPSPASQDGTLEFSYQQDVTLRDFLITAKVDSNSVWLSTIPTFNSTNWNLPLGNALTSDYSRYADTSNGMLAIQVFGPAFSNGSINTTIGESPVNITLTAQVLPLPTIPPISPTNNTLDPTSQSGSMFTTLENLPETALDFSLLTYVYALIVISLGMVLMLLNRLLESRPNPLP